MPVTQEGPDLWSRYCPVQAFGLGEAVEARSNQEARNGRARRHQAVASSAASTRTRICMSRPLSMNRIVFSGTTMLRDNPAGIPANARLDALLRRASSASASRRPAATAPASCASCSRPGIEVLEVTTPDKHDRRRRGKNDDLDAQNAAHAAFAGKRTVTPKSRDGMIESLRVLKACRKTAVAARRIALQMIQNTIVCAPDELRDAAAHHDPHAARPDPGRLATRSDRLSRCRIGLPDQPASRSLGDISNCMTRSRTSTR